MKKKETNKLKAGDKHKCKKCSHKFVLTTPDWDDEWFGGCPKCHTANEKEKHKTEES